MRGLRRRTEDLRVRPLTAEYVDAATRVAQSLGHDRVGSEHMLIALAEDSDGDAARALARAGLSSADIRRSVLAVVGPCDDPLRRPIDGEALAALGIDLDEVRERVEATFGVGALERPVPRQLPVAARLRQALVMACTRADWRRPPTGLVLLSLLEVEDSIAARILREHEIDAHDLHEALE